LTSRHATRDFDRGERVGAELLRELTGLLRRGVKDPRLGDITLHEVRVSRDLAHAKVFFTCFPADEDHDAQARLLNGPLAGFLRHELARSVRLRTVPQLHFVHDESIQRGEHLDALIEQAVGADDHDDHRG
jgi:ribosome-binding factor A